ncbi:MAG: ATP synthase F1 subunit epsilon [Bacteroidia bacterium]|nr:ATP synthase F1 subunit epsilon [Bacteroidia bacterium]
MKTLELNILTPEKTVFSGEVASVQVKGTNGGFQVLHNHAPMISTLQKGEIKVKTSSEEKSFSAGSGVMEVLDNKVIILIEEVIES